MHAHEVGSKSFEALARMPLPLGGDSRPVTCQLNTDIDQRGILVPWSPDPEGVFVAIIALRFVETIRPW